MRTLTLTVAPQEVIARQADAERERRALETARGS
jgi:hypothetical protein